jgi:mRNA interferase RelE/StbE
MLKIQLSKRAAKFLSSLPTKQAKQILSAIDETAKNPSSVISEKLKGYKDCERVTIGEYRFIFRIQQNVLILNVLIIGKRNDDEVYKIFKRIANT